MKVILDPLGGVCGGVSRVIKAAEEELARSENQVYILGDIIHNEREVERLNEAGLKTIYSEDLDDFEPECDDARVLIRAHGEPPETFEKLERISVKVIDSACPVVVKSQNLADKYYHAGYQVAIIGKHGHPEMIGIVGHTNKEAVIVQYDEDVKKLKCGKPTLVMSQTTISPDKFSEMTVKIKDWVGEIVIWNTICKSVIKRGENLNKFARQVDVLLVVGGHKSSNTKMLHNACMSINSRSYHVATPEEIDLIWFNASDRVGITGSASTPLWLLEEFVETLERWIEEGKIG